MNIRQAPFALRVVQRRDGLAAILYRRRLNVKHEERLDRVAALGPLATTAGAALLRTALRGSGAGTKLIPGPFSPLDADWGARVCCYALVARGLRNASRLSRAAEHLRTADAAEAAWWFGLMQDGRRTRAVRALRIITEAVK
jgi:hypothetical protein